MTRSEFIHRAVISMCTNPEMVNNIMISDKVVEWAESLADRIERDSLAAFDSEEEEPQERKRRRVRQGLYLSRKRKNRLFGCQRYSGSYEH